jgi:hypothetical protein
LGKVWAMAGAAKASARATARMSFFMTSLLELQAGGSESPDRSAVSFTRTTCSQSKGALGAPLAQDCCCWGSVALAGACVRRPQTRLRASRARTG